MEGSPSNGHPQPHVLSWERGIVKIAWPIALLTLPINLAGYALIYIVSVNNYS